MECSELETYEIDLAYGEPTREDARAHVETCPRCQARLESIAQTRALARDLIEAPSPRTREAILAAARSRLQNDARASTARDPAVDSKSAGIAAWISRFAAGLLNPQLAMVGVAAFALVVGLSVGAPYLSRSPSLEGREAEQSAAVGIPASPLVPEPAVLPIELPATQSPTTARRPEESPAPASGVVFDTSPEVKLAPRHEARFRDRASEGQRYNGTVDLAEQSARENDARESEVEDESAFGRARGEPADNQVAAQRADSRQRPGSTVASTVDVENSNRRTQRTADGPSPIVAPSPARQPSGSGQGTGTATVANTTPMRGGAHAGDHRGGASPERPAQAPSAPASRPGDSLSEALGDRATTPALGQREQWLARARVLRRAGRLDEAMVAYANARRLSPGDEVLGREIAEVEVARRAARASGPSEAAATQK